VTQELGLGKFNLPGRHGRPTADISDAGLAHLDALSRLQIVYLFNTKVSDEGKKRLQRTLPGLSFEQVPGERPLPN